MFIICSLGAVDNGLYGEPIPMRTMNSRPRSIFSQGDVMTEKKLLPKGYSRDDLIRLYQDPNLTVMEKAKKLGINTAQFYQLAEELNIPYEKRKKPAKSPFKCKYCGNVFDSSDELKTHQDQTRDVLANPNLSIKEKKQMLNLSSTRIYHKLLERYGMLTKERFLEVYSDPTLSNREKARKLMINERKYYKLRIYFGFPPQVRKIDVTPDLIQQVVSLAFHFLGINKIAEQLFLPRKRVREILVNTGFKILSPGNMKKAKEHYSGVYWVPMRSELIKQILDGFMLGDGDIRSNDDEMGIRFRHSIDDYKQALDVLHCLKDSWDELSVLSKAVDLSNDAATLLSEAQTAQFRMHKALQEEKWVRFVANFLETHGYRATIPEPKGTIRLEGQLTVQMYFLFKRWYINGVKRIPHDLELTPLAVLVWFAGDGSAGDDRVVLCSHSFNRVENYYLADLLRQAIPEILVRVVKQYDDKYSKWYHYLVITDTDSITLFYKYLDLSPPKVLSMVKKVMPSKFP